jgi:type IV pilus assembly protein PilA
MFQKFHAAREEREGGFTLIELLVVILIIAILAAIAIPVFLNQRKKGWRSQTESAVKNAATAEESWLTVPTHAGYASTIAELQGEGFTFSATAVTMSDPAVDLGKGYCLKAESINDTSIDTWYGSWEGRPSSTSPTVPATLTLTCPAA